MFVRIAADTGTLNSARADELFRLHPSDLAALLEMAWSMRVQDVNAPLGSPRNRAGELRNLPEAVQKLFDFGNYTTIGKDSVQWDHLIYAYLIENTRVVETFRQVLFEYLHGEKLSSPLDTDTQAWLRNTEALFFATPSPFAVYAMQSEIRPDPAAYRRNAYYRMFGMDLNHGGPDDKPYSYLRAKASNNDFVTTLEQLLYQIWIGIANFGNSSGENRTDNSSIATLARQLNNMLLARRQNGNLSRTEFSAVAMMSAVPRVSRARPASQKSTP